MQVRVDIRNGCTICGPKGNLDASTAPDLREAMSLITSVRRLVIDLSDVRFIDSAALGALVGGIRRVRDAGGEVVVCCNQRHLRRVLESIGFTRVVPLVESVGEAQRLLVPSGVTLAGVA